MKRPKGATAMILAKTTHIQTGSQSDEFHNATQTVRVGRFNSVRAYVCPVWTQTG